MARISFTTYFTHISAKKHNQYKFSVFCLTALVGKVTFASLSLLGGQDEAVCYAETATSPDDRKFANHLININGDVVLNKRKVYERSRANAWNNEDSILKLATAIMRESSEMKKRFGIDAIDVSSILPEVLE